MARPLKQWLYKHRDNPYPTKTEKILLALGSHMTLVQVGWDHILAPLNTPLDETILRFLAARLWFILNFSEKITKYSWNLYGAKG